MVDGAVSILLLNENATVKNYNLIPQNDSILNLFDNFGQAISAIDVDRNNMTVISVTYGNAFELGGVDFLSLNENGSVIDRRQIVLTETEFNFSIPIQSKLGFSIDWVPGDDVLTFSR